MSQINRGRPETRNFDSPPSEKGGALFSGSEVLPAGDGKRHSLFEVRFP